MVCKTNDKAFIEIQIFQWLFMLTCGMLSCCKEVEHMNNALKKFYYRFYTPLPMAESEQEIETCHQQLIERLEKPERKLVLRIMDAQNLITEERSMDSFLCGFQLAWELAYELNHFETNRHPFLEEEKGGGSLSQQGRNQRPGSDRPGRCEKSFRISV